MPWVVVWPVLVAAALVVGFLLWRDLWRRAKAFGRAGAAASRAVARLSEGQDELAAAAEARHPVPPVALRRDPSELRADLAAAREARDRRLDARHARYRQLMRGWLDVWR